MDAVETTEFLVTPDEGVQHYCHVTVSGKSQILNLIKAGIKVRLHHLIPCDLLPVLTQ